MAKGQVTDKDLASGLQKFGGFGALGGQATKPRREDPFRDTRSFEIDSASVRPEPQQIEAIKNDPSFFENQNSPSSLVAETLSANIDAKKPKVAKILPQKTERVIKIEKAVSFDERASLFTERVTVPLEVELRDRVELLAKQLQRKRTDKGERITSNTVVRVALRVMLERFIPNETAVNTEQDLYSEYSKQLKK